MKKLVIQEKQLKKVRAKQKRLQAILGGEDTQRVEFEFLAEDDGEEGNVLFFVYWLETLTTDQWVEAIFVATKMPNL